MTEPDPWRCALCGAHHPIPSLARACEQAHLDHADDGEE